MHVEVAGNGWKNKTGKALGNLDLAKRIKELDDMVEGGWQILVTKSENEDAIRYFDEFLDKKCKGDIE